jgi:hypothetical protein
MRISVDDGAVRRDIQHLKDRLPDAAEEASLAAAKEFGELLRSRVQAMIPNKGGWYDIYRNSIRLVEVKDGHWELTTVISVIAPSAIPAESSLVWVSSKESADAVAANVARLLSQHNPWSLDTIPALDGGMPADLVVKPASSGEVEHYRKLRLADLPSLGRKIKSIGGRVLPFDAEPPRINGRVLADVPFLALRLEYGYGGFSKTPIWSRIDMEGEIISKSKAVQRAGYGTFASRWRQKK